MTQLAGNWLSNECPEHGIPRARKKADVIEEKGGGPGQNRA
jgi:hypothetical protein